MRFITSRFEETVEELTSTKSPNYVLLTPKQVQIVINGHKMDHRSQESDYDPSKDMPKLDLPVQRGHAIVGWRRRWLTYQTPHIEQPTLRPG